MSITAERKQALIQEYARGTSDTGSPEVQTAILSERIRNLTEHLQTHPKDFHSLSERRPEPGPAPLCGAAPSGADGSGRSVPPVPGKTQPVDRTILIANSNHAVHEPAGVARACAGPSQGAEGRADAGAWLRVRRLIPSASYAGPAAHPGRPKG
jgi:hypothetical protein